MAVNSIEAMLPSIDKIFPPGSDIPLKKNPLAIEVFEMMDQDERDSYPNEPDEACPYQKLSYTEITQPPQLDVKLH